MTTSADVATDFSRLLSLSGDPTVHSYYTFIAFQLAADRAREASRYRLAREAREARGGTSRRSVALALAALGRVVAGTVRRLDAHVADDLAESIRTESLAVGN